MELLLRRVVGHAVRCARRCTPPPRACRSHHQQLHQQLHQRGLVRTPALPCRPSLLPALPARASLLLRRSASTASAPKGGVLRWYQGLLETRPLLTKCVTSGGIAFAGDIVCQHFFQPRDPFSWSRTANFTILGTFLLAPTLHLWYGFLGRTVVGATTKAAALRLVADQALFAPMFIPTFFAAVHVLEGRLAELPDTLQNDLVPTIRTNWLVWIPAQFINFRFIPGLYQVLFANAVGFCWNIYLSRQSHQHHEHGAAAAEAETGA